MVRLSRVRDWVLLPTQAGSEIDKIWKEYRLQERTRLNVSDLLVVACRVPDLRMMIL